MGTSKIESKLFEFLKRKAFQQSNVGIGVRDFQFTPFQPLQDSIYSLHLLDLIQILESALSLILKQNALTVPEDSSKLEVLLAHNLVDDNRAKYLKWYKKWRNEVAHQSRLINYSELEQVTEHVQDQFLVWNLIGRKWNVSHFWKEITKTHYRIGSRIGDVPIFAYDITYSKHPQAPSESCSYGQSINLSLADYLQVEGNVITNQHRS